MTKEIQEIYITNDLDDIQIKIDTKDTTTLYNKFLEKFTKLLTKDYIYLENDLVFDRRVNGCWCVKTNIFYGQYVTYNNLTNYIEKLGINNLEIPTISEIKQSISFLKPYVDNIIYESLYNKASIYSIKFKEVVFGPSANFIPILRLFGKDIFEKVEEKTIFNKFLEFELIPREFSNDKEYLELLEDKKEIPKETKTAENQEKQFINYLLNIEKERINLTPYDEKILEDINRGHWSLWEIPKSDKKLTLSKSLIARNPNSDIKEGVVGIDFGTKSTVVAYQGDDENIYLLQVGSGDFKNTQTHHFENPTIMELNDIKSFLDKYTSISHRPFTKWKDIKISHEAFYKMINSPSKDFNSYITELKQWAGDKRELKVKDKTGKILTIPPFLEKLAFNPIEIYAYYLGGYINNQFNGIFTNYILSFPVTYEVEVRDKILESFKKGLKKSLPKLDKEISVEIGASEPAAYAISAFYQYQLDPEGGEKLFYGVFDFGGGTTDFDFGIFKESSKRKYDYEIEHFGAGGDKYLGGENLLALLAFEVVKDNKDILIEKSIQFRQPPQTKNFTQNNILISNSREAQINTKTLIEELRGVWEDNSEVISKIEKEGIVKPLLYDINSKPINNLSLKVDIKKLYQILEDRIKIGVLNFFEALTQAFGNSEISLSSVDEIHIFLAGNSSKSKILQKLFEEEIKKQTEIIKEEINKDNIFKLYLPLEGDEIDKPNSKTGVAFGLIEARKGGRILVKNRDLAEDNISFKYYLGMPKKRKFKTILDKNTSYNEWVDFIEADENIFEVYYTSSALAITNDLSIKDSSIKKKILKIDLTDEEANIYIRVVNPTTFEYVVAYEEEIKNNQYLTEIKKVEL